MAPQVATWGAVVKSGPAVRRVGHDGQNRHRRKGIHPLHNLGEKPDYAALGVPRQATPSGKCSTCFSSVDLSGTESGHLLYLPFGQEPIYHVHKRNPG